EPGTHVDAAQLLELTLWRMLPLAPAGRKDFALVVEKLRDAAPQSPWLRLGEMLLALEDGDRAALLAAANDPPVPTEFPTRLAEGAHEVLLVTAGVQRARAGLEVLAARRHEALYALRDLDRGLTREAAFFRGAGRVEDADRLLRTRDALRRAY